MNHFMRHCRARHLTSVGTLLIALFGSTASPRAFAAQNLRKQIDQRGDLLLIGNTLGWDCEYPSSMVLAGNVDCSGASNVSDTAIDVYWRADSPVRGDATASAAVAMADASSTAVLEIPEGAVVTYARAYWGAFQGAGGGVDSDVLLDRPGTVHSASLHADASYQAFLSGTEGEFFYQGTADVTALFAAAGAGPYRMSGVSSYAEISNYSNSSPVAGWAVVVFYTNGTEPMRNLTLFDGFDFVSQGAPVSTTLSGFLVPNAGYSAHLAILAYEGDESATGDSLLFNGTELVNALNPAGNFFNSSHSLLGATTSHSGELPQLSGAPGSMGGLDLDVVDVTSLVQAGQTTASIGATSSGDRYVLGAFATSISTFKPDFATTTKSVVDLNGGELLPGDVLEYVIEVKNSGNDVSVQTRLTDPLSTLVTYVPGSLRLLAPTTATWTDASGDDPGWYDPDSRTVFANLGEGATALTGGKLPSGATVRLAFLVNVRENATGAVQNQATISAAGELGAKSEDFPSDGNQAVGGSQATVITIGNGCATGGNCGAGGTTVMTGAGGAVSEGGAASTGGTRNAGATGGARSLGGSHASTTTEQGGAAGESDNGTAGASGADVGAEAGALFGNGCTCNVATSQGVQGIWGGLLLGFAALCRRKAKWGR